ncbi:MAG: NAD(P)H-dependent oxidoreductase [Euryarchaeota archaeon]|uniref:flavodoxin family protein n=1 Tax=Methanobacterium sp. MZD130B TaxID=3394378 RepID=UPI00177541F8|nr:NAD(P)H-dependent oxidoreductase [Euryarchaeota archaeon]HHT18252.1 flavodoxin [Methanobacterium sp.]
MKIGIIVHSQTNNTYSVAVKLQKKLQKDGNEVNIKTVDMVGGNKPQSEDIQIENPPDVTVYDGLIFGSPVHAFSLAPAMKIYLEQIPSLHDKKVALYVTKALPLKFTGGTRAIGQMEKICQSKGGNIMGTDIVVWRGDIDKKINELTQKFSLIFEL